MSSNWLSGWLYRKKITISNQASSAYPANGVIRVKVQYGSGTDSTEAGSATIYVNGKCRSDFGDIRFTSSDGVTLLSQWLEEKSDGNYAIFWVKVPDALDVYGQTAIYMYYGNQSATLVSDDKATFAYGQDFRGSRTMDESRFATRTVNASNLTLTPTQDGLTISATTTALSNLVVMYALAQNTNKVKIVGRVKLNNTSTAGGIAASSSNLVGTGGTCSVRTHHIASTPQKVYLIVDAPSSTTLKSVDAQTTAFRKHVLKLVMTSTATVRWEMDGTMQYESTAVALNTTLSDTYVNAYMWAISSGVTVSMTVAYLLAAPYNDPDYALSVGSEEVGAREYKIEFEETVKGSDSAPKTPSTEKKETGKVSETLLKSATAQKTEIGKLGDTILKSASAWKAEIGKVSDALLTSATAQKTETSKLIDALSRLASAQKTETGKVIDAASFSASTQKSEAGKLADALAKTAATTKVETGTALDEVLAILAATRTLAEEWKITEKLAKAATTVETESQTIADNLTKTIAFEKREEATITDFMHALTVILRMIEESSELNDAVSTIYAGFRTLRENTAISANMAMLFSALRALGERTATVDSVAKAVAAIKSEATKTEDRVTKTTEPVRTEIAKLPDVVLKAVATTKAETGKMADTVATALAAKLAKAEGAKAGDHVAKTVGSEKTEIIKLPDALLKAAAAAKAEASKITDTVATQLAAIRTYPEEIKTADGVSAAANRVATFEERIGAVDGSLWHVAIVYKETWHEAPKLRDEVATLYAPRGAYMEALGEVAGKAALATALLVAPLILASRKEKRSRKEKLPPIIIIKDAEDLRKTLKKIKSLTEELEEE